MSASTTLSDKMTRSTMKSEKSESQGNKSSTSQQIQPNQPSQNGDKVFLEGPFISAALADQFQKDGVTIPGPILSSELNQQVFNSYCI